MERAALLKAGLLHSLDSSQPNDQTLSINMSKVVRQALEFDASIVENLYPRELYEYLDMEYTLLDVEAMLFPEGMPIPFTSHRLPVGLLEDYMLFTCNKHTLLGCLFMPINSPVGAIHRIQMYLVKSALAFSLAAIVAPLIRSAGFTYSVTKALQLLFNLFCVTPLAKVVSQICLAAASAFTTIDAQDPTMKLKRPFLSFLIIFLSRVSLMIISGMVMLLLVVASVFSYDPDTITFIEVYLVQVMFPSVVMEACTYMLLFYPYSSAFLCVRGRVVVGIGKSIHQLSLPLYLCLSFWENTLTYTSLGIKEEKKYVTLYIR